MKDSYALITGASSGIGLEIANSLAKRGFNLILTARNEVKLIELSKKLSDKHGIKVDFVCSDLSQKESPQDIYNFCTSNNYHIDLAFFSFNRNYSKQPSATSSRSDQ